MPLYEYACKSCGERTEARQSVDDPPLTECPNCGGPLRKVFGSIGISFKGSGFYRTDSRAAARSSSKVDSKAESSPDAKGDGAKTDGSSGDGAKADGAKADGAKGDGAKPAASPASNGSSTTSKTAPAKSGS
jgi:putative FmdB family regulatory protein